MICYIEKILAGILIIKKNSILFIAACLFGVFLAIALQYSVNNNYDSQIYIKINFPKINSENSEQTTNNEIKILLLQVKDKIFYTEEIEKKCSTESYSQFISNLNISEARGIGSVLKINYSDKNPNNSEECIEEIVGKLDYMIKKRGREFIDSLEYSNKEIEKNINSLLSESLKINESSLTPSLAYLLNKSKIDAMYQDYRINKQNIFEISKSSGLVRISQVSTRLKIIYINKVVLYSVTLMISLLIAFSISIIKEYEFLKK